MSTPSTSTRPGTLQVRLMKSAGFFLIISIVAFALVNILANLFQHTFVLIVEAIVVGVPFLVAVGCALGALVALIGAHSRHA